MQISISQQLESVLEDYRNELQDDVNDAIDKVSKEAVRMLKATSPRRTGEYAAGWTTQKGKSRGFNSVTVYNKVDYLTYLLENSHVVRNSRGTYGRSTPQKHIATVEEWANNELVEEIERMLK